MSLEFEWDPRKATRQQLLVVSHTERGDRIRIISARQLTEQERRDYEEDRTGR